MKDPVSCCSPPRPRGASGDAFWEAVEQHGDVPPPIHSGATSDGGASDFLNDLWKLTWPKRP